jgi:hypothetical protein
MVRVCIKAQLGKKLFSYIGHMYFNNINMFRMLELKMDNDESLHRSDLDLI